MPFFFPLKYKVGNNTPRADGLNLPMGLHIGGLCPGFSLFCPAVIQTIMRPGSRGSFYTTPPLVQTPADLSVLYSCGFHDLDNGAISPLLCVCCCFSAGRRAPTEGGRSGWQDPGTQGYGWPS